MSKYDLPGLLRRSDAAGGWIQMMAEVMPTTLLLPSTVQPLLWVWRHLCGPETAAHPPEI